MLVTPLPGVDCRFLSVTLRDLGTKVANVRGGGHPTYAKRLTEYLGWVHEAARMLHYQVSEEDIRHLVLTRRYEILMSFNANAPGDERVLNDLLGVELAERVDAFEQARTELKTEMVRWSKPGVLVVLDTSFYIHHPEKLEELNLEPLLKSSGQDVHIIVPIAVVDELDGLKQSKDKTQRWRARYSLAVLDTVLQKPPHPGELRPEVDLGGGRLAPKTTIEIMFDPPGHVRLPINDDEIIDRAVVIGRFGTKPKLITYDTGMAMRGRAAGLAVIKRPMPPAGDEPSASQKT